MPYNPFIQWKKYLRLRDRTYWVYIGSFSQGSMHQFRRVLVHEDAQYLELSLDDACKVFDWQNCQMELFSWMELRNEYKQDF